MPDKTFCNAFKLNYFKLLTVSEYIFKHSQIIYPIIICFWAFRLYKRVQSKAQLCVHLHTSSLSSTVFSFRFAVNTASRELHVCMWLIMCVWKHCTVCAPESLFTFSHSHNCQGFSFQHFIRFEMRVIYKLFVN